MLVAPFTGPTQNELLEASTLDRRSFVQRSRDHELEQQSLGKIWAKSQEGKLDRKLSSSRSFEQRVSRFQQSKDRLAAVNRKIELKAERGVGVLDRAHSGVLNRSTGV